MSSEGNGQTATADSFVERFVEGLSDPIHKRLIQAYRGEDPVGSMEAELSTVLKEVMESED